jgi:glycosyltransferase involved in cell wall biosynthesis
MKVLITTDNIGGVWTFVLNLSRGLVDKGIDVRIVVMGEALTESQRKEIGFTDWYFIKAKQEWMNDPWQDLRIAGNIIDDIVQTFRPDVIHLNSYAFGSMFSEFPVIISAHSCVLSWWEAVRKEQAPPEWDNYMMIVGNGIRSADAIVTPSRTMMSAIEKHYSPEGRKYVIYNGITISDFRISEKQKFVFSMGRLWDEAKNITRVIEASGRIGYPVHIAGDMRDLDPGNIPANVSFRGKIPRSEVTDILSHAAIYFLPVIYEPFGYTFLEAALSGCAIVTGDIPSMHEIWGDSVIYADPFDAADIAEKVNELMNDDLVRSFKAASALERAKQFTSEKMVTEYSNLYQILMKKDKQTFLKLQEQ